MDEMTHEPIIVEVGRELERLIPLFLRQRNADAQALQNALRTTDFDAMRRTGHSMVGAGRSYGFQHIGELGEAIEAAAQAHELEQLRNLANALREYLSRLKVKFV